MVFGSGIGWSGEEAVMGIRVGEFFGRRGGGFSELGVGKA